MLTQQSSSTACPLPLPGTSPRVAANAGKRSVLVIDEQLQEIFIWWDRAEGSWGIPELQASGLCPQAVSQLEALCAHGTLCVESNHTSPAA
jgi:hypothetical protein